MIVDAIDEADALAQSGRGVVAIEESQKSIERNRGCESEKCIVKYEIPEMKTHLEQQVDRLIIAINQNNRISIWEKRFVFGIKRNIKKGHNLSSLQLEKFEKIYGKVIRH